MGKWSNLTDAVAAVIRANGNREITGQVLQNALLNIISNLGNFASFAGVATPSTNPGTPDGPVYYFATQAGTYTNFGALVLDGSCYVLYWNGTAWSSTKIDLPTTAEFEAIFEANEAARDALVEEKVGDITNLQNDVSTINNHIKAEGAPVQQTLTLTGSSVLKTADGSVASGSRFVSDYIAINSSKKYNFSAFQTSLHDNCAVAFYDEDKVFISSVIGSLNNALNAIEINGSTTSAKYFRFCSNEASNVLTVTEFTFIDAQVNANTNSIQGISATLATIQQNENVTRSEYVEQPTTFENGYLLQDGTIGTSTTRSHSDYIQINTSYAGIKLDNAGGVTNGGFTYLCYYASDKTFISKVSSTNSQPVTTEIPMADVPNNAVYIRVGCLSNASSANTNVYFYNTSTVTLKQFVENGADKRLFGSPNFGKSVAVFGGSFSALPVSNVAKDYWAEKLGVTITNYGVGGAGFRKTSAHGTDNIQIQVDRAIASGNTYDIWLLWASTNDFGGGVNADYIGDENYYIDRLFSAPTYQDGDTDDKGVDILDTQCGGMNYCIYKILQYQPTAKILFFTSIRAMSSVTNDSGWNPNSANAGSLAKFVEGQIAVCKKWGIPYLDQFMLFNINPITKATYISNDGLHPNEDGYTYFRDAQVSFLANN